MVMLKKPEINLKIQKIIIDLDLIIQVKYRKLNKHTVSETINN